MYDNENEDICLIATDHGLLENQKQPDPNKWQSYELELAELDGASGVCWHPASVSKTISPLKPSAEQHLSIVRQEVASWFVQLDGKFIPTTNKDSRLGKGEIEKILPQMLAERFPGDELVAINAGKLTFAVIYGTAADPRSSFGVYSGKAYPTPGNPSKRLYRNGMWDLNTWCRPTYRDLLPSSDLQTKACSFEAMLKFAIPDKAQQTMLLDWLAWNLQNEGSKPNWAIMLYSETKGTGKSTIAKVLTALFGQDNTASTNGIKPLTQRFSADTLDRKLVVAEEVHISSHSSEGNALKDLITNTVVSVERKYQPIVTIPQVSCFLFMTNHKPLWLEGGERRYYIIDMDHEGHAQGAQTDEFYDLAAAVNEQVKSPRYVRDLYERLMTRELSVTFDPNNMRFADNATPIMRELQANAGNEGEQVLQAILAEHHCSIILSEDFPDLIAYLRLRNSNSLRNMLSKLDWEARRIRFGGAQYRAWCKKDLEISDGRVRHNAFANTYDPKASQNGYAWFDLEFYVNASWKRIRYERLLKGRRNNAEDYEEILSSKGDNSEGKYGPFAGRTTHLRLQARTQEELETNVSTDEVPVLRVS
jgi:hypothetical protein